MEDIDWLLEKIGSFLQIEPDQAVSFQRLAFRTKGVWSCIDPPIRQKFSKLAVANRTENVISCIQNTQGFQSNSGNALKVFPWDEPDNERNQFFHQSLVPKHSLSAKTGRAIGCKNIAFLLKLFAVKAHL